MEEEKKLYPFRFCTLQDDYSWGSEEFRMADLGYRDTLVREGWLAGNAFNEIMDMYLDRIVGETAFDRFGRQFPVCVRQISVDGRMPLRVCPDDLTASQRYDFLGKDKLWYILDASASSRVMLGFNRDSNAGELYSGCLDNSVEALLNSLAVHAGDVIHIPAGTPHAADGKMTILEIGQSSPLDFCLCGWGEEVSDVEFDPALSLVDALDFISYAKWTSSAPSGNVLLEMPSLRVSSIKLDTPIRVRGGEPAEFNIYTCVEGEAAVQVEISGEEASFTVKRGESLLVPAECSDFVLVPLAKGSVLLESGIPNLPEKDEYINPDVEAVLPDGR